MSGINDEATHLASIRLISAPTREHNFRVGLIEIEKAVPAALHETRDEMGRRVGRRIIAGRHSDLVGRVADCKRNSDSMRRRCEGILGVLSQREPPSGERTERGSVGKSLRLSVSGRVFFARPHSALVAGTRWGKIGATRMLAEENGRANYA